MDFAAALAIASKAVEIFMEVEPVAVQAISDLKPYATALIERLTGSTLTDDQRTEMETNIDALHAQFQAPIPPEDQQ